MYRHSVQYHLRVVKPDVVAHRNRSCLAQKYISVLLCHKEISEGVRVSVRASDRHPSKTGMSERAFTSSRTNRSVGIGAMLSGKAQVRSKDLHFALLN